MISVLICTYKRPNLIEKCLISVINQKTEIDYEIIIVDNDINFSAKNTVQKIIDQHPHKKIIYTVESSRGIANARNKSVEIASNDFLLFIDDDEIADENWIDINYKTLLKLDADGLFGSVIPLFPEEFPDYIKKSIVFTQRCQDSGTLLKINQGYMGNTFIKKDLLMYSEKPFDINFNFGGEDTELFNSLLKKGKKLFFCKESIVYEIQDEKRLSLNFFYKKSYRGGYSYLASLFKSLNFKTFYLILKTFTINIIRIILYSFLSLTNRDKYILKVWTEIGKLIGKIGFFFKINKNEYQ